MEFSSRHYGVEVEFINLGRDELESRLNNANIDLNVTRSGDGFKRFRIVNDESLRGSSRDNLELITPIIKNKSQEDDLETCLEVIQEMGGAVNKTCALHVHFSTLGMNVYDILDIVKKYKKFESAIDNFMPYSRRQSRNRYCTSLNPLYNRIRYHEKRGLDFEDEVRRRGNFSFLNPTKYTKINLRPYPNHKTIEFRHHSGTLNFNKIAYWVRFLDEFITNTIKESRIRNSAITKEEVETIVSAMDVSKKHKDLIEMFVSKDDRVLDVPLICKSFNWKPATAKAAISKIANSGNINFVKGKKVILHTSTEAYRMVKGKSSRKQNLFDGIDDRLADFYYKRAVLFNALGSSS